MMIKRLLIANRGEIAVRIAKTARKMGIETVAVYSDSDRDTLHTKSCDKKIYIGSSDASKSYLNIKNIITAAKKIEADAIHPGYGFLSENYTFAEKCEKEQIIFVGPSSKTIRAMAVKTKARNLVNILKVPVLPGFDASETNMKSILKKADEIGYPIMIKAAFGGGGRGMRAVYNKKNFINAYESASRESLAAFGKDNLLIEKLVSSPRHIEVQIAADNQGNILHFFERDCSIQRKNQKIIEEAPALNIDKSIREEMYNAAIKIARKIKYNSLGTVEFLMDKEKFYFMEMNTRLQVEHAITEKITGIDLVEMQINIAEGKKIALKQTDVIASGHAIEARLYAEDPEEDYKPSPGKIHRFAAFSSKYIRNDIGFESGDEISPYYDSMVGKIIAHGRNRKDALLYMRKALVNTKIFGIKNNKYLLYNVLLHKDFINGSYDTKFLLNNIKILSKHKKNYTDKLKYSLVSLWLKARLNKKNINTNSEIWLTTNRYRINVDSKEELQFIEDDKKISILIDYINHSQVYRNINQEIIIPYNNTLEGEVFYNIIYIQDGVYTRKFEISNSSNNEDTSDIVKKGLESPMPGKVVKVFFKVGDKVDNNSVVMMVEAMKMEHSIISDRKGIIKKINCMVGDWVDEGASLVEIQ